MLGHMINHAPTETQLSRTADSTCVYVQTRQFVRRLSSYSDLVIVGAGGPVQQTLLIVSNASVSKD